MTLKKSNGVGTHVGWKIPIGQAAFRLCPDPFRWRKFVRHQTPPKEDQTETSETSVGT